jgi:hypothetical protein
MNYGAIGLGTGEMESQLAKTFENKRTSPVSMIISGATLNALMFYLKTQYQMDFRASYKLRNLTLF